MPALPGPSDRALPEPLERLSALALDLHWSWNHAGDAVWRRLDESLWERTQNPWLLLQHVPLERLERLARIRTSSATCSTLETSRARYRATPPWRPPGAATLPRVAYFSMEFGLHEALPLYAGGLGILAGDYLKTASDLDVPVIGIGILWQQGYFRQVLDAAGRQTELYPFNEPASLPVQPVVGAAGDRLRISLTFPGRTILLRAWQVTVGRTMLYLLDSNDPFNAPSRPRPDERAVRRQLRGPPAAGDRPRHRRMAAPRRAWSRDRRLSPQRRARGVRGDRAGTSLHGAASA